MSEDYYNAKCAYFDANIIRMLVNHPEWYWPLFNFLFINRFYLALSNPLIVELSQTNIKHEDLSAFFAILPSDKIKSIETVIEEEIKSYPKQRAAPLLLQPSNIKNRKQNIGDWLITDKIEKAKSNQMHYVKNMKLQLDAVKSDFLPSNLGTYTIEQAEAFSWMITMQWLTGNQPAFMRRLNDNGLLLKAEAFQSIQLFSYYVYFKYFLGNRKPKEIYEIGNLFHLFYFPYCKLIILGRDMYNIINRIKSRFKLLDGVELENIDFFNEYQFMRE